MPLASPPLPAAASALDAARAADTLVVPSALLDAVTVHRADLFTFPAGVLGFEECRVFVLVPAGRDGLWWLQSAERAELVFLLADPFAFFDNYEVAVPAADLAQLGADARSTLMTLAIVTLPRDAAEGPTANLRAPLVLDVGRRVGRQVVLADETYGVQTPFALG